jgi:dinuclear metal center YbgI/SA1388 family protein
MQVKDLISWLNSVAPFDYAEPWDNVGLQVGDPDASVRRVLCALDPTSSSIMEAARLGCECLVTHHPLFLEGIKTLNVSLYPQRLIFALIRQNINLIVAHTNLDVARISGNCYIADMLSLQDRKPIDANQKFSHDSRYVGMGLVGRLQHPCTVENLCFLLKKYLKVERIHVVGELNANVSVVAVCTGSGGSLLGKVKSLGADCFITGELKYHNAVWAEESKLNVIALGHFGSEKFMMERIARELKEWSVSINDPLEVFSFEREEDHITPLKCSGVGREGC